MLRASSPKLGAVAVQFALGVVEEARRGVDELVGVCEPKAPVAHGVHPDGRVVADVRISQQCARHDGNIPRGRVVRGVVSQPGGIEKVRVFHAECLRALVHTFGKGRLRAADMLGHGDGAVVCGDHRDALNHIRDR